MFAVVVVVRAAAAHHAYHHRDIPSSHSDLTQAVIAIKSARNPTVVMRTRAVTATTQYCFHNVRHGNVSISLFTGVRQHSCDSLMTLSKLLTLIIVIL